VIVIGREGEEGEGDEEETVRQEGLRLPEMRGGIRSDAVMVLEHISRVGGAQFASGDRGYPTQQ
jgi:hypothetical protein